MPTKMTKAYLRWMKMAVKLGDAEMIEVLEAAYKLGKIDGKLEQLYSMHPELKQEHAKQSN
mgnify:CR=1 FL=1